MRVASIRGPYAVLAGGSGWGDVIAADAAKRSSGDFAVHFTFEVTPKATGRRTTLEEVGVYTVNEDKITREQFYYEGSR